MPREISVVVPTLNEAPEIARSVHRAFAAGAAQVLVADGGSSDGTAELARQAGAEVVVAPRGRAAQMNAAAGRARGEVLVFLHADTWLPDGALGQVDEALADRRVVGGAFRQRIDAPGMVWRLLERGNALRAGWLRLPYGDQGLFVRTGEFAAIGGFAPIALMEDVDFARRLRRRGRMVLVDGPLVVSPRRWRRHGVLRQTLRNWCLLAAWHAGVSPQRLARYYPPCGSSRSAETAGPGD